MAQRLLVERNDKSVESVLNELIVKGKNNFGRAQALWTLEGLQLVKPNLLSKLLIIDQNSLVHNTALRLLEPFVQQDKNVRTKLDQALLKQWHKAPIEEILQDALSSSVLDSAASISLLTDITDKYGHFPLIRDAVMSSIQNQEFTFLKHLWKSPQWQKHDPGKEIFIEMLATAVMRKKDPTELTAVLAMLDETGRDGWRQKAVVTGLAMGGADNKLKPVVLLAPPKVFTKKTNKAESERLAVLSSLFEWPGHKVNKNLSAQKSQLNDEQQRLFVIGRQQYLTTCSGCHGTDGAGMKRFAPPLAGSDWVLGDEKRLALIVLHGMEGRVKVAGKIYDTPEILPVMPAHSTMDDGAITAILTYIRNEWGNHAGPIGKRTVSVTRNTTQGRVIPWKPEELKKYVVETPAPESK
jgi:mono/diheme cytochrome c family protein